MAFWGENDWLTFQEHSGNEIVSGFDKGRLKDGCYRLKVGREGVFTIGPQDTEKARRNFDDDEDFEILPGQFTYLITEEDVQLPPNAIGLINISTGEKVKGLVNVSGFHVDAGYSGKLVFTVFNAGATRITLHAGQALFRLWLIDYRGEASNTGESYRKIPKEWSDRVIGAYPSPFSLANKVVSLENELASLKSRRVHNVALGVVIVIFLSPFLISITASVSSDYIINTGIPALVDIKNSWRKAFPS